MCLAKCRKSHRHLLDTSTLCLASAPDACGPVSVPAAFTSLRVFRGLTGIPSQYFLTRHPTLAPVRAWSAPRLCLAKCRKSDRHLLDTSTLCNASAPDPCGPVSIRTGRVESDKSKVESPERMPGKVSKCRVSVDRFFDTLPGTNWERSRHEHRSKCQLSGRKILRRNTRLFFRSVGAAEEVPHPVRGIAEGAHERMDGPC